MDAACIKTHPEQIKVAPQPPILGLLLHDVKQYPAIPAPANAQPVSCPPLCSHAGRQLAPSHLAGTLCLFGSTQCAWSPSDAICAGFISFCVPVAPVSGVHLCVGDAVLQKYFHCGNALKAGAGAHVAGLALRTLLSLCSICPVSHHHTTPDLLPCTSRPTCSTLCSSAHHMHTKTCAGL